MPKMSPGLIAKLKRTDIFVSIVYLVSVLVINPTGNFPINDDWIFARQVQAFMYGEFTLSALIDPSFILQALLGTIWVRFFGWSFTSLRFLTIIFTIFLIFGISNILRHLKTTRILQFVSLCLVVFNAVVFSSSLTFMTEIYFLVFFAWNLYFYLRFLKKRSLLFLFLGSTLCGFSILIRHIGIVTGIAFILVYFKEFVFDKKRINLRQLLVFFIPISIFLFVFLFWPKYATTDDGGPSFFSSIIEPKFIFQRIKLLPWTFVYFSFFSLPLCINYFLNLKKRNKIILVAITCLLVSTIYIHDIFPIGSVFYIEKLHAKTNFRSNLSLFDNVIFKAGLSFFVSLSVSTLLLFLVSFRRIKGFLSNQNTLFLIFVCLGMFMTLSMPSDLYDRYLLPVFIPLLLLVVLESKVYKPKLVLMSLGFIILVTLILNYEYLTVQRLKWEQARSVQELTGFKTQIFLDGVYTKYTWAQSNNDYTGLIATMPAGLNYKCFVQEYTLDSDGMTLKVITLIDDNLQAYINNPRVYGRKKIEGLPKIKKHLDELIYNREYFSPLYTLIGKRAYVGSWCYNEAK